MRAHVALGERLLQEKVYNIQAEEEKMLQAATSTYILLGHATALCYSVFAETVYLTSEGVVEKFKDGQVWCRPRILFCVKAMCGE